MSASAMRTSTSDPQPINSNELSQPQASGSGSATYFTPDHALNLTSSGNHHINASNHFVSMGDMVGAGQPMMVTTSNNNRTILLNRASPTASTSAQNSFMNAQPMLDSSQQSQHMISPGTIISSAPGNFMPHGVAIGSRVNVNGTIANHVQSHQIQRPPNSSHQPPQSPMAQHQQGQRFVMATNQGLQQIPLHQIPSANQGGQMRPQQMLAHGQPGSYVVSNNPQPPHGAQPGFPSSPTKSKSKKKKAPAAGNQGAVNSANNSQMAQHIIPKPHECQPSGVANNSQTGPNPALPPKPKKKKSSSGKKLSATALKQKAENERYGRKHYLLKRCVKALVFKNGALCDEVARLKQRILTVSKEREILVKRLFHHERLKQRKRVNAEKRALAAAVAAANANKLEVAVSSS